MRRVLVWSNDPIGRTMAGPGIRYLHFARALSREFEVTLAAPELPEGEAFETRAVSEIARMSRRELGSAFDVMVAQSLTPAFALRASRAGIRLVIDLYAPSLIEGLAYLAAQPGGQRANQLRYDELRLAQATSLAVGDAFLCANERQRDLWLGALALQGRLSVESWLENAAFAGLVTVVPFGLESDPPLPGAPALRGVVPGIAEDDFVLLWNGGIWNWLDPLTVIEAVGELARMGERPTKLVFLGVRHPSAAVDRMTMLERAIERAGQLELTGTHVFFNEGWVPYDERRRYLLEADVGVSAHFDTLETRYAFRTRLLDCIWAGLPIVCTGGDTLGDLLQARGAGVVLRERDVAGWVDALGALAGAPHGRDRYRAQLEGLREEFSWQRVCEPLVGLIAGERAGAPVSIPRAARARSTVAAIHASVARRGVLGSARAAVSRGRRRTS